MSFISSERQPQAITGVAGRLHVDAKTTIAAVFSATPNAERQAVTQAAAAIAYSSGLIHESDIVALDTAVQEIVSDVGALTLSGASTQAGLESAESRLDTVEAAVSSLSGITAVTNALDTRIDALEATAPNAPAYQSTASMVVGETLGAYTGDELPVVFVRLGDLPTGRYTIMVSDGSESGLSLGLYAYDAATPTASMVTAGTLQQSAALGALGATFNVPNFPGKHYVAVITGTPTVALPLDAFVVYSEHAASIQSYWDSATIALTYSGFATL